MLYSICKIKVDETIAIHSINIVFLFVVQSCIYYNTICFGLHVILHVASDNNCSIMY